MLSLLDWTRRLTCGMAQSCFFAVFAAFRHEKKGWIAGPAKDVTARTRLVTVIADAVIGTVLLRIPAVILWHTLRRYA